MRSPSIASSPSSAHITIAQACATGGCSASSDGDDFFWRGLPKRMDWVNRSQVMSLADYWRMSGRMKS